MKSLASANFDETVELVVRLAVDPRKAEEALRGTVALPSGSGKDVRVAVFAAGEAATAARDAGADIVGGDDLAETIEGGTIDFDVAIATPDMMPTVGKLGRVLGPRGLMPNPKTGTVTPDVAQAVGEFKGGKVEYRTDKNGVVHVPIGKASFDEGALVANFSAVMEEIHRAKPASAQGQLRPSGGPVVHHGPRREGRSGRNHRGRRGLNRAGWPAGVTPVASGPQLNRLFAADLRCLADHAGLKGTSRFHPTR